MAYFVKQTAMAERLDVLVNWVWGDMMVGVCSLSILASACS